MADADPSSLLFFDTFSHQPSEDLNLDLVQFPHPVLIHKVHIVPLGAKVHADVAGGVRLGATNPSSFKLELFVNNLAKPNNATFVKLGGISYSNVGDNCIPAESEIPTDGLILKGWYSTLTVGVFGSLTTVAKERAVSPPPPPPPQAQPVPPRQIKQEPGTQPEYHAPAPQPVPPPMPEQPREWAAAVPRQEPEFHQPPVGAQVKQEPPFRDMDDRYLPRSGMEMHHGRPPGQNVVHQPHPEHADLPPRPVYGDPHGMGRPPEPPHPIGRPSEPPHGLLPPEPPRSIGHPPEPPRSHGHPPEPPHNIGRPTEPPRIGHPPEPPPNLGHPEAAHGVGHPSDLPHGMGHPPGHPEPPRGMPHGLVHPGEPPHRGMLGDLPHGMVPPPDHPMGVPPPQIMHNPPKEAVGLPPEMREIHEAIEAFEEERQERERDLQERRYRSGSREREFPDFRGSREGSRERDGYSRDSSRESREQRDRSRDHSRDRPRERDIDWDLDRGRERRDREEWDKDWDRDKDRERRGRGKRDYENRDSKDKPRPRSPPFTGRSRSPQRSRSPLSRESSRSREAENADDDNRPLEPISDEPSEAVFEPMSPEPPSIEMYSTLSDPELHSHLDKDQAIEVDDGGYEDISDEEIDDMDDFRGSFLSLKQKLRNDELMGDIIFDVPEDMWNYTSYSPYQFELMPMTTFFDPALTPYQVEKLKNKMSHKEMPQEALDILDIMTRFGEEEHTGQWVEAMENIPNLLNVGLSYLGKEDIIDTLISWTLEGLDFKQAIAQPENKYKLRHLKIGIRLVGCLCSCDVDICLKMMKHEVQLKLLKLYVTEHMSISVKLQILRSLDQTLRFQTGMDWFLGQHPYQAVQAQKRGDALTMDTAYQALLDIMLSKQLVRAVVAISAVLKKVNAYEVIRNFQTTIEPLLDKTSADVAEEKQSKPEDSEQSEESDTPIDLIPGPSGVPDGEMDKITNLLDDLTRIHASALHALGFPGRTLPAKVQFQITQKPIDPFPFLYHTWHSCNLLESIFSLLLHPATYQHSTAFLAIKDFFLQLISCQSGLTFIASRPEITNGIIRALLQNSQEDVREEGTEENPPQQLGLQLVHYLHTLSFIDLLFEYHKKENREGEDEQDMISFLHGLYIMTFTPVGREAVTHVFSLGDNLRVLTNFLELTGNDERDMVIKRSVPVGYSCSLLKLVIHQSDNGTMLEKFGKKLCAIVNQDVSPKLNELKLWLDPIQKMPDFSYDSLEILIKELKHYSEEVLELPRGLITTLRILHYWGIPSEREVLEEGHEELRFKYVLTELFTGDCIPLFQNILTKISDIQQRPWQQGIYLATNQGQLCMAVIVKVIALIKAILQYLILARGTQFRDTTLLPALFSIHTIVCSAPPGGLLSADAQKVQNDIVDTIMAFTQPSPESYESEDILSQSLWTKTLEELFKYLLSAPYTYMSGLLILSELLPLPLPVQTKEPLDEEEIAIAMNQRKLWSAHLLYCNSAIHDVIKVLATTSCQPLQHVMRRVCWQLTDLSMPIALNLVKHILDLLLDGLESITEVVSLPGEGDKPQEVIIFHPSSVDMAQALNLLSYLLSQAPVKAPVLHLLRSGAKSEERYMETLPKLLHLLNVVSEKTCHIQAQECIVSIIQYLCDMDIILISGENIGVPELLSMSLPSKDHLHQVCLALLDHIGNMDHSYASILPALRTLVMLTEHDYGFFHLKGALDQNHFAFFNLFMRINNTFSKDSSDCLSTLSTATELLHLLVTLDTAEEEQTPLRTFVITVPELRQILSWREEGEHPLYDLEKLLVECAKEEEALESLLEGITSLLQDLRSSEPVERKELVEPVLPAPESLANQFSNRPMFMLTDPEDDRLTLNYWLSCPGVDDFDQECELVPRDFEEMALKCNLDFNLKAELEKGTGLEDPAATKVKRRPRIRGARDTINTSSRGRGNKGQFVAPMRGRGFNRGMGIPNRHDPFRSRPPNTSRPPSMHVDDFVKMENQQGPPKPGGGASGPQRREKDFGGGHNRGRGGFDRGRGGPGRGRFFTPPGNYGRRDGGVSNRGMGGDRGSRGGLGNRGGPPPPQSRGPPGRQMPTPWGGRSKQLSPRGIGGRGRDMDNRPPVSMERHTGRDNMPRFTRGGNSGGARGRGGWMSPKNRDDSRFMPPPGGGFRGGRRDQGRHVRSFTK